MIFMPVLRYWSKKSKIEIKQQNVQQEKQAEVDAGTESTSSPRSALADKHKGQIMRDKIYPLLVDLNIEDAKIKLQTMGLGDRPSVYESKE